MKIFDITPKIQSKLAVFPGDVAFERQVSLDFNLGNHLQLSAMRTTLHLGAHADSSSHYHPQGQGIEKRPLEAYFGRTQVIHVPTRLGERVQCADIQGKNILAPRVLFFTNSFPDPDQWNHDFMSLSPELIFFMASQGVKLLGIDTPSVDPETSQALESHQALFQTGICVLEGLALSKVPEGVYSLVALPLPIVNGDASPVRAILFEDSEIFKNFETQIQIIESQV